METTVYAVYQAAQDMMQAADKALATVTKGSDSEEYAIAYHAAATAAWDAIRNFESFDDKLHNDACDDYWKREPSLIGC